ncbi:MAG: exonuclease SbcC, partial [Deltaproteobacteria bacterium]|nr:exonuclease SbcC [Deltaproteobacteria bacterium]
LDAADAPAPAPDAPAPALPPALSALTGEQALDLVRRWEELADAWRRDERDARELETAAARDAHELPALDAALRDESAALAAEEERHAQRGDAHEEARAALERLGEERARLARLQEALGAARADAEALSAQREQARAAHAEALERAHAASVTLAAHEAMCHDAQRRWEEQSRAARTSEEELDALSETTLLAARVALREEERLRQELDGARARAAQLRDEVARLTRDLKADRPLEELRQHLRDRRVALQDRHSAATGERLALSAQLANNQAHKSQHAQVEAERRRLAHELSRWERLNQLIGSANGNTFRDFAQSLTLELILEHANCFLRDLAPRYSLMRIPDQDLALQVVDHDFGDEVRSMQSLSGGETFLVSLSLALGLSSTSAQDVQIQSLFIDEGFGTLDPASLDLAISVLENLQVEGRLIGMISHVEGLSERVGLEVRVEPQGGGRSALRVRHHA